MFEIEDGNSKEQFERFNLIKYFSISSVVIVTIVSVILGFVFVKHEKKLLIDYGLSSSEEFAHQLSHQIFDGGLISTSNGKNGITLAQESLEFEKLDRLIRAYITELSDIVKIKIYDKNGVALYSTAVKDIGAAITQDRLRMSLAGHVTSRLTSRLSGGDEAISDEGDEPGKVYKFEVMEIYIPIYEGGLYAEGKGKVIGVFEIYKDVSKIFSKAKRGGFTIFILFAVFMTGLFLTFQLITRKADKVIKDQNAAIEKYNTELEEAQQKISESIDEVIEHESFHVRYVNNDLLRCWEFKECTKTDCPSYNSDYLRCWQVAGTFCGGEVQGYFANKYGDCRVCDVFKHAFNNRINSIGESFNNMMALLQSKHLELEEANHKLNILIDIDPLTQISNRRSFQNRIESIHLLSLRYNHPYSIIICDIDNFKLYNDTYGHQQGDYVLVSVANTMKSSLRRTDEIFRWGGEEFIIILPEQNHSDALKVAENLRSSVQSLGIEHRKSELQILTTSCGVASFYPWKTKDIGWDNVVKQADDALYKAKTGRKNCVYSAAII